MRCEKCGKKLRQNEKFCTVCGFYNDGEPDDEIDDVESWETAPSKHVSKAIQDLELDDEDDNDDNPISDDEEIVIDSDDEGFESYIEDNADGELIDIVDEEELKKKEKKKEKKEKKKKEKKPKEKKQKVEKKVEIEDEMSSDEKEFYYDDEDILEAYIGEDYKIVKKKIFNIFAFLLSWAYVLYRKLYITGILGLILTGALIVCLKNSLVIGIYATISMLFWGIFFNKYYIFIARRRVNRIKNKADDTDRFKIINICAKKGGVSIPPALIIYFIFLVITLILLLNVKPNKNHNLKFWDQNSENKATCIKLIKIANKDLKEQEDYSIVEEATCRVDKTNKKKEYSLYLKTENNNYLYYQTEGSYLIYKNNTENITSYQEKEKNNTITDAEKQILIEKQNIKYKFESIHKESIEEDKKIKKKINTSEKLNYYFEKEEINR